MKPYKIDIAVLFIFFCREEQTRQVFEAIKKARPSKLFLYQDGAREGRNEGSKIEACRAIVEDIDWECEIHRMYQTKNFGCDPSEYISQKWMFSHVDKGIVLEDDDIPSQSFFPFCKELLERYENDTRINMICGMNNLQDTSDRCSYSYFFSESGSIWGWATWKRNIDQWDSEYKFLQDPYTLQLVRKNEGNQADNLIETVIKHKASGKEHYESILGMHRRLNSQINIVPTKNLITNIGITAESTHSVSDLRFIPSQIRRVFNMERYEIQFPLSHPPFVVIDRRFQEDIRNMFKVNIFIKLFYKLKRMIYLR